MIAIKISNCLDILQNILISELNDWDLFQTGKGSPWNGTWNDWSENNAASENDVVSKVSYLSIDIKYVSRHKSLLHKKGYIYRVCVQSCKQILNLDRHYCKKGYMCVTTGHLSLDHLKLLILHSTVTQAF